MTFRDDAKRWWKSLTIQFAGLLAIAAAVVEYVVQTQPDLTPYLGKWGPLVMLAIGIVNVLLRLRTASAIIGTKAAALPTRLDVAQDHIARARERYTGVAQFPVLGEPPPAPKGYPDNAP